MLITLTKPWSWIVFLCVAPLVGTGCTQTAPRTDNQENAAHKDPTEEVQYIGADPATGTSAAVLVNENLPLVHTTQLLPLDKKGQLVGSKSVAAQTNRVLENIQRALQRSGTDVSNLIKLNVYVPNGQTIDSVKQVFTKVFPSRVKPAATFAVSSLPHSKAKVAIDAVAAAPPGSQQPTAASVHAPTLYGDETVGHAAVLPPGERVYISGQAEKDESVVIATEKTMQSLHKTLDHLGTDASQVVQVKAFLNPMAQAQEVREKIASFYPDQTLPSIVLVEWTHQSYPVEIEMIAAADTSIASDTSAISYITPPGMSSSTVFSRVAQVHRGNPVYISGLYGSPAKDAVGQIRDIFTDMGDLLNKADSDFKHLVKATYYTTSNEAGQGLGKVRPNFYDPKRPPAASLAPIQGVGSKNAALTVDMIAVATEENP